MYINFILQCWIVCLLLVLLVVCCLTCFSVTFSLIEMLCCISYFHSTMSIASQETELQTADFPWSRSHKASLPLRNICFTCVGLDSAWPSMCRNCNSTKYFRAEAIQLTFFHHYALIKCALYSTYRISRTFVPRAFLYPPLPKLCTFSNHLTQKWTSILYPLAEKSWHFTEMSGHLNSTCWKLAMHV